MAEFWLGIFSCRRTGDATGTGNGFRPWKNTVRCGLGLCLERTGIEPGPVLPDAGADADFAAVLPGTFYA
jgi:hypothetical protein